MKRIEEDDDGNESDDSISNLKKDQFYLTELGENHYEESSDDCEFNDDDDDDLVTPKKKLPAPIFYENDIYNEKEYDTDLEGTF